MIKFEKLYEDAIIPKRQTIGSAAYDLHAYSEGSIEPNETLLIKTGVRIHMDNKTALLVCSRSGLALKKEVHVLNNPGIVDSDFKNEIGVILHNSGKETFIIKKEDRIAQAMFVSYLITDDDNAIGDRIGGFGSTN